MRTDRQTDRNDERYSRVSQFCQLSEEVITVFFLISSKVVFLCFAVFWNKSTQREDAAMRA